MGWFTTIVSAALTAVAGTLLSGYVANLSVRWYRISSFEGGSGYYVVGLALAGGLAAFIIGVIIARVVAGQANLAFPKALLLSLLTVAMLVGIAGGWARLLADIPPTVDGEALTLVVEARWPETTLPSPATAPGSSYLELGSVTLTNVQRIAHRGALWKEDARKVDGRWTVTGAVPVFTERGKRSLQIALNATDHSDFTIALPRRPGQADFTFTPWMPERGKGVPEADHGVTYRYRVQKQSLPVRTETIGPFDVSASIPVFMPEARIGESTLDGNASFFIRYRGQPVAYASDSGEPATTNATVTMVAELPGARVALLALVSSVHAYTHCALLVDDNGALREERVAACSHFIDGEELTNDSALFARMKSPHRPLGRVDRQTYTASGHLLFSDAVLDVSTLQVRRFSAVTSASVNRNVPPLGYSPDGRTFARFAYADGGGGPPLLVATDIGANATYTVPIDSTRMRWGELDDLTPAWFAHYFEWLPTPGASDRLVARVKIEPIPYHGTVTTDEHGVTRLRFSSGGAGLRDAIVAMLGRTFKVEHGHLEATAYDQLITVDGVPVRISTAGDGKYVGVEIASTAPDNALLERIAKDINTALATGKYDEAFIK